MEKIGFGGSCHWCTEAIFQSLNGVVDVKQGWAASDAGNSDFSEAVLVAFDPKLISLKTLIEVHLYTHSCTSEHSMRSKYRSAVYTYNEEQAAGAKLAIENLQPEFDEPIITAVLHLIDFKRNKAEYLNYYYSNPEKPFCQNIVNPKLKVLMARFGEVVDREKLGKL